MRMLFIIPARGGSKGLPKKNIKDTGGKPMIVHSLNYARLFTGDENICVTTDDKEIADVLEAQSYKLPFLRPSELASDNAAIEPVLHHAIKHYEEKQGRYDLIVLLQPTSPWRKKYFLDDSLSLFHRDVDMVVSVKESKANPYFNLFEEENGYLKISKTHGDIRRRQDAPKVYQYNGVLYLINRDSLFSKSLSQFQSVVKYVLPENYSIDIDTETDWHIAEYLYEKKIVDTDGKY